MIELIATYLQTEEFYSNLKYPVVINSKDNTSEILSTGSRTIFQCNHEEADTRLIFHSILMKQDVVIVSKDTEVMVLLVWAYEYFDIKFRWLFKLENNIYSEISLVCKYLGGTYA